MREEISEPQHWRSSDQRHTGRNASWSSRRRSQEHAELAAEAVDAAMTDAAITETAATEEVDRAETLDACDIISSLASQLDMLEKQREQLQQLLSKAQLEQ